MVMATFVCASATAWSALMRSTCAIESEWNWSRGCSAAGVEVEGKEERRGQASRLMGIGAVGAQGRDARGRGPLHPGRECVLDPSTPLESPLSVLPTRKFGQPSRPCWTYGSPRSFSLSISQSPGKYSSCLLVHLPRRHRLIFPPIGGAASNVGSSTLRPSLLHVECPFERPDRRQPRVVGSAVVDFARQIYLHLCYSCRVLSDDRAPVSGCVNRRRVGLWSAAEKNAPHTALSCGRSITSP